MRMHSSNEMVTNLSNYPTSILESSKQPWTCSNGTDKGGWFKKTAHMEHFGMHANRMLGGFHATALLTPALYGTCKHVSVSTMHRHSLNSCVKSYQNEANTPTRITRILLEMASACY